MGVASPTMGGNIERTVGTMHYLPVGRGGSPSTGESAATVVVVSFTASSTVASMGLPDKQRVVTSGS